MCVFLTKDYVGHPLVGHVLTCHTLFGITRQHLELARCLHGCKSTVSTCARCERAWRCHDECHDASYNIGTKAGQMDSQWVMLPNWGHWYP